MCVYVYFKDVLTVSLLAKCQEGALLTYYELNLI